jgi:hypothetical protein
VSVDTPPTDDDEIPARSVSRLPMTNRAGIAQATEALESVPVALDSEIKLRREGTRTTRDGGVIGESWSDLRDDWRSWFLDSEDALVAFHNRATGEIAGGERTHSFTTQYQKRQAARAHDLERGLRDQWGTTLYAGMLTLSCSPVRDDNRLKPPLEHLNELDSSWDAVRRELSRSLEDREWEYLAIMEPHKSGYTHVHVGVFVRGPVSEEDFEPVIDAHLRNCEGAGRDAHDDAISVRNAGDPARSDSITSLGSYLTAYMTQEYGDSAIETPDYLQRWYSLMWAAPVQRFRASNGAQAHMAYDGDTAEEPTEWEIAGIAPDGDLDDIRPLNPEAGGVDYDLTRPPPTDDPPPD